MVHLRFHAGRDHRRLPRGGVHQEEHQAGGRGESIDRGQQEGGGDLHEVRAEGNVQYLSGRLLRDAGLRVRRAVFLYRLPDLDRGVRLVPGHLYGQRGRRLGQREEGRGSGPEAEGDASARRDRGGRYSGRSIQGHLIGGNESGDQVHHAVWIACRGAGGEAECGSRAAGARAGGRVLRGVGVLRAQVILWNEDWLQGRQLNPAFEGGEDQRTWPVPFLWPAGNKPEQNWTGG